MDIVFPVAVLVLLLVLLWELRRVVEGNAQIYSLLELGIQRREMESILAIRDAAVFRERMESDGNLKGEKCSRCRISLGEFDRSWIDSRTADWFFCSENCLAATQSEWREAELSQELRAATWRRFDYSEKEIAEASVPWWRKGENPPPSAW